ncbi:MAG: hypothetical protein JXA43_00075 [Candidatus Diapherotrites archaeon]|nr:hypothetical protein [Candidatus Diapherotrites archaeon]
MVEIINYLDPNSEVDFTQIVSIANENVSEVRELFHDLESTRILIWGKAKDLPNINPEIVSEKINDIEQLKKLVKNYEINMQHKFREKKLTEKRIEDIIKSKDEYIKKIMEELAEKRILPLFEIAVEENKQKEMIMNSYKQLNQN